MTIEERLEELEVGLARAKRYNRLLLIVVIMVFSLLAIAATSAIASRKNIIEASEFNLLDVNGETIAYLAVEGGGPMLKFFDKNQKIRFVLSAVKEGAAMSFYDENTEIRAGLYVTKYGPVLTLFDPNGKVIWEAPR
jgi:hypothetical protein